MKISEFLKSAAVIVVILAVFGFAACGLNFHTAPIIDANNAGAANGRLNSVMPAGAEGYEDITSTITLPQGFVDPANSSRTATVVSVNKETSGLGYVIEVHWTSEDTHGSEANTVLVGISTDGKIIKINNETYHDTDGYNIFNKDPNYASSFEGQDSTLASIGLVAGSTHSSSAFRSAVSHAFEVLLLNDMITAGVKGDDQIISELLATLHKGIAPEGVIKATDIAASGNIVKGWKSTNDTGSAYMMTKDGASYLVLVNSAGHTAVYNTEGTDVSADHADLASEALAASGVDYKLGGAAKNKIKNFNKDFSDEATSSAQLISFTSFNTVALAAQFTVNGETVYMIQAKPLFYQDTVMTAYIFLDAEGKIIKTDIATLYVQEHYIPNFGGTPDGYLDSFNGEDHSTFNGDDTLISGATLTSNAVKMAIENAFEVFNSIKGGEQ